MIKVTAKRQPYIFDTFYFSFPVVFTTLSEKKATQSQTLPNKSMLKLLIGNKQAYQ
ncbi:hypothetical protein [Leuconostoc gasicomitatum]|uniref:Uncharacterized protein n=1 Tax=Leuconostoc gasicomitatum TaxID=115778 RepID=A0A9Q3SZK6_9LACO|nr:hypothetical protein [Leuconostoc gasicomitatum]MBZ5962949.1 hypothetical protein [Leuconostoc gasicomitatum]